MTTDHYLGNTLLHSPSAQYSNTRNSSHRNELRSGRIDDIEILRAIAVIFVIIHHCHGVLFTWPSSGLDLFNRYFNLGSGVNIFFGVSGFVIARSLLPSLLATESNRAFATVTLQFWVRRAWRLLPSACLWLVLIQIAAICFNDSNAFMAPRANFAAMEAGLLNFANFRFAETFGTREYGASFPYWSLSLEEQFYLSFPILVFIFKKYISYAIFFLIAAQWALPTLFYPLLQHSFRTDGLLAGVLIAIWSTHGSYRRIASSLPTNRLLASASVPILLIALAGVAAGSIESPISTLTSITVICAILVFIASFDRNYTMPSGALKRIMMWVGSRSYALYLIHIPAFCLTREIWFRIEPTGASIGGAFTLRFTLTALALLAILSELNYRLVEHPLRLHGAEIAERLRWRRDTSVPQPRNQSRWHLAVIGVGWALTLMMADAGRRGLLDGVFERPIVPGQELTANHTFERLAGPGWSSHETWGIWSVGSDSVINIPLSRDLSAHRTLFIKGAPLITDMHPTETITFEANGVEIGRYVSTVRNKVIEASMEVPTDAIERNTSNLRIDILVDTPVSPHALGLSDDTRNLGFGLASMKLQ